MRARLFVVTRALHLNNNQLSSEQVTLFLGHRTVLTFQEGIARCGIPSASG